MKTLCEGSRRPVRGERHQLKSTASRHSSAVCPVCNQRMTVNRVLGRPFGPNTLVSAARNSSPRSSIHRAPVIRTV